MPADIATSLKNWYADPNLNTPTGGTLVSNNLDDNLRTIMAVVRALAAANTIAGAATTDIGSLDEAFLTVSGAGATITALGTVSAGIPKFLIFSGIHTLTHNATSLILPGAANITTAAGDVAMMLSLGSGNWRCLFYSKASGNPVSSVQLLPNGTVAAPSLSFASETTLGIYRLSAGKFAITADGVNRAVVVDSSNMRVKGSFSVDDIIIGGAGAGNFWGSHGITVANGGGVAVYITAAGAGFVTSGAVSGGSAHLTLGETSSGVGGRYFITAFNNTGTAYKVETNGAVYSDAGTAMTTPADYAEMFEWADGNPLGEDRVGYSVALVGEKIKIAQPGDQTIGIVSGNPAVLGDAGDLRWVDQFLRDDFNRPILDAEGQRVLNPAFDPGHEYIPRRARKEWCAVGLVGKLRLRNGQVTNPLWKYMRDISPSASEWLLVPGLL